MLKNVRHIENTSAFVVSCLYPAYGHLLNRDAGRYFHRPRDQKAETFQDQAIASFKIQTPVRDRFATQYPLSGICPIRCRHLDTKEYFTGTTGQNRKNAENIRFHLSLFTSVWNMERKFPLSSGRIPPKTAKSYPTASINPPQGWPAAEAQPPNSCEGPCSSQPPGRGFPHKGRRENLSRVFQYKSALLLLAGATRIQGWISNPCYSRQQEYPSRRCRFPLTRMNAPT
jgi:hypothetical protein